MKAHMKPYFHIKTTFRPVKDDEDPLQQKEEYKMTCECGRLAISVRIVDPYKPELENTVQNCNRTKLS